MADKHSPIVTSVMHRAGFDTRPDPTVKYATGIEKGRADIMFIRGHSGGYIEIKNGVTGLALKKWTPQQRAWAALAHERGCSLWFALILGQHPVHYNPDDYKPRRFYLIPYTAWRDAVAALEECGEKTLPYRMSAAMRKRVSPNLLDSTNLFSSYALSWYESAFHIVESHSFYGEFLCQTPNKNPISSPS